MVSLVWNRRRTRIKNELIQFAFALFLSQTLTGWSTQGILTSFLISRVALGLNSSELIVQDWHPYQTNCANGLPDWNRCTSLFSCCPCLCISGKVITHILPSMDICPRFLSFSVMADALSSLFSSLHVHPMSPSPLLILEITSFRFFSLCISFASSQQNRTIKPCLFPPKTGELPSSQTPVRKYFFSSTKWAERVLTKVCLSNLFSFSFSCVLFPFISCSMKWHTHLSYISVGTWATTKSFPWESKRSIGSISWNRTSW